MCKCYFNNLFCIPFYECSKIQILKITSVNFLNLLVLLVFTTRIKTSIFLKFYQKPIKSYQINQDTNYKKKGSIPQLNFMKL